MQTISYEIVTQASRVEHIFVPAGGGGLTLAVTRGFQHWSWPDDSRVRRKCTACSPPATIRLPGRCEAGLIKPEPSSAQAESVVCKSPA